MSAPVDVGVHYVHPNLSELNRLTSASGAFGACGYTYDANGNRTVLTLEAGSVGYGYAPASNRLTAIDATPVTPDPTGNTLALRGGTLLYTTHNRLLRAYDASSDTAYRYNGLGERVEKVREGTTTTRYVYGLDGALLAETDAAGAVQVEYVYLEGAPLAVLYASGTVPLAYVHTDALGTPRALTNAQGVVVWRASYDPFGMATVEADPDGDGQTLSLNLRFPGQYYDAETGLHYNYFRTYDPSLGRYLESDPIGLVGGLNTYGYVGGSPLRYIDPLGLEYAEAMAAAGATAGATVVAAGSIVVDAATGGLNILATPAEVGAGATIGGGIGYGIGSLLDRMLNENASDDNQAEAGNSCPIPGATPGRETKGRTKQFEKPGDFGTANDDFDALDPTNVKDISGGGRVGDLSSGDKIIVRPTSSDGRPTIEIQRGKNRIKVRYGS